MGLFRSGLTYAASQVEFLKRCPYRSSRLEKHVTVDTVKIGSKVRDSLVKPLPNLPINGLGYDGDVEGVDVEPSEKE